MKRIATFTDVVRRLEEAEIPYKILDLGQDAQIIVSAYGGRVLGPFVKEGRSLSWINEAFLDGKTFRTFVQNREWNLGGDRFWVAPEHPLFVQERSDFNGTYSVPDALDPGKYLLAEEEEAVCLKQTVLTPAYESAAPHVMFQIFRQIIRAGDPLAYLPAEKRPRVQTFGYNHAFMLEHLSASDGLPLEPWNLLQVHPGGKFLIPYNDACNFVDYYEPAGESLTVHDGFAELMADGYTRYKVAFHTLNTTGRSVYVNRNEAGLYLIYKQYYNDPANPYCCDPADRPGERGCSLFFYNDNGENGAFAEFENSGLTVGKEAGRNKAASTMSHIFFTGEKEELEKLIYLLLDVQYNITI